MTDTGTKTGRQAIHVAVLVESSTSWGRGVITGIQNFARRREEWHLIMEPRGPEERFRVDPEWNCHGVIARVSDRATHRHLRSLRVPVVNVSGIELPGLNFPQVCNDLRASGELAANYFAERGYRHCAYFSHVGVSCTSVHRDAFVGRLKEMGCTCDSYKMPAQPQAPTGQISESRQLGAWLRQLPKPVGLLAWNPVSATEAVHAAIVEGLRIPEEVSVLSGSDDRLFCEVGQVEISAIQTANERIGFDAASVLDGLFHGEKATPEPAFIAPLGIVTRQSTDTLAIHDKELVSALNFIRSNARSPVQVTHVSSHCGLSRRHLERRFAQVLGRSPAEEIRRFHLECAKRLLVETDLSIPQVAEQSGFGSPEYMAYVFKRTLKQTPLRYRRQIRSR